MNTDPNEAAGSIPEYLFYVDHEMPKWAWLFFIFSVQLCNTAKNNKYGKKKNLFSASWLQKRGTGQIFSLHQLEFENLLELFFELLDCERVKFIAKTLVAMYLHSLTISQQHAVFYFEKRNVKGLAKKIENKLSRRSG